MSRATRMVEFYTQKGLVYSVNEAEPFAFGRTSAFFRGSAPDGTPVCIKVFRKLEDLPEDVDEFLREIIARQHIQHEHVLPILGYGVQEVQPQRPFLVLPYCSGGDLRDLMGRKDLVPLSEALVFLKPLASAIDSAHSSGLIHGDIKPENILFGESPDQVFITDFGTVKIIVVRERVSGALRPERSAGDQQRVYVPEGTELYLSPEELEDGRQTPLSDIYSFAFVAYEVLTGQLPLDSNVSSYRRMQAKIEGRLIDPLKANPKLGKSTRDALMKGLSVDPSERPTSATEFCEMLGSVASERMKPGASTSIEVFFSYAHEDETLRDQLAKHLSILQRQGVIKAWHDRKIVAGSEWKGEIVRHLEEARVILLLVSADFVASEYCYDIEMRRALERHTRGQATVIPVIVRPVTWSGAPFAKLQALPKDGKAVTTWENRDAAFLEIAEGIRRVIGELHSET